jgi:hypothetical protein
MVKLREAGLSLAQIGKRLGISRQRVQKALALQGKLRVVPIRWRLHTVANNDSPVYYLDCLPATPFSASGSRHAACLLGVAAWDGC